jgi:hypothetical protein
MSALQQGGSLRFVNVPANGACSPAGPTERTLQILSFVILQLQLAKSWLREDLQTRSAFIF